MRNLLKLIYVLICVVFIAYLLAPSNNFPIPPLDSEQSDEPADIETPYRRAYFTNSTRNEALAHYANFFGGLLLNYPPEEAQTLIRDQTRSSYLQELVVPFRESLYINGFIPTQEKDAILINAVPWKQKIIARFIPSSTINRLVIYVLVCIGSWFSIKNLANSIFKLRNQLTRLWMYR
ncbi:MAG: hypothetical protein ACD_52C00317G0006 [uncultured bacterium]|uniref:Uncharacterized protein n=1 Tax=Candidatus Woesebacteria bacterium RIFCSPHIGHO2_12_FULL_41_24 TaxID=1802510 RepID=A0A1F8ARB3_9BACT|nr:MAG: hypothetical protein ACD_52C00317G0006 [uncultured bacterium]OGM13230.1 MAG: hypothetical protein A2W15_04880 [Candidatus Woesebacteria bacterium RBG_16_41_13]OGM30632.1 MAG: hypothetical protein A2873_00775 [Candidatus Woesebacteria bacterium RIFCSPHIGHO2_01_FULL_42_80]OGM35769.1 MAG: hypothetical protein A3D84_00655 [Candidatus Woesebacteria bacterium RIFCSPHIGHO2_02_FULL_42_20]OGM53828.1 MAG: hypothetical protein A3E44_05425 [Candidatus Woesebacteria bacterium RIFCSPHIGHO2_12_FULL_41